MKHYFTKVKKHNIRRLGCILCYKYLHISEKSRTFDLRIEIILFDINIQVKNKVMKAIEIIDNLIYSGKTENKGVATSFSETQKEFINEWFGNGISVISGYVENNANYLYSYNELLSFSVNADMVLKDDKNTIYLYKIEK